MNESPAKPKLSPWTIWAPIIIAVLGIVVFYNYLIYRSRIDNDVNRPPILGRLEKDLELTERSGKKVHLADLKGKVLVISWVFTRCPRGCAAVIAKLKKLHEEFGSEPGLHFLSFTLDADDTPEMMKKFASGLGIATSSGGIAGASSNLNAEFGSSNAAINPVASDSGSEKMAQSTESTKSTQSP